MAIRYFIVRKNDSALMRTHWDLLTAEWDINTTDPNRKFLTMTTSETHKGMKIGHYDYVVPNNYNPEPGAFVE